MDTPKNISIRVALREDCPALMTLIRELAVYERAPGEVTVHDHHFEQAGFGPDPVWWAVVAEHQSAIVLPCATPAIQPGKGGCATWKTWWLRNPCVEKV